MFFPELERVFYAIWSAKHAFRQRTTDFANRLALDLESDGIFRSVVDVETAEIMERAASRLNLPVRRVGTPGEQYAFPITGSGVAKGTLEKEKTIIQIDFRNSTPEKFWEQVDMEIAAKAENS